MFNVVESVFNFHFLFVLLRIYPVWNAMCAKRTALFPTEGSVLSSRELIILCLDIHVDLLSNIIFALNTGDSLGILIPTWFLCSCNIYQCNFVVTKCQCSHDLHLSKIEFQEPAPTVLNGQLCIQRSGDENQRPHRFDLSLGSKLSLQSCCIVCDSCLLNVLNRFERTCKTWGEIVLAVGEREPCVVFASIQFCAWFSWFALLGLNWVL